MLRKIRVQSAHFEIADAAQNYFQGNPDLEDKPIVCLSEPPMKISVVIPVRNEAESIQPLLDALLAQSLPPAEILITDGGSIDATPELVAEYARRHPSICLFREVMALPGRGRNVAARNASHEWLAFIDAGVLPAADWLAQLAQCAAEHDDADMIFGSWEPVTDTFFTECAAIAYAYVPNRNNLEEVKRGRAIFSSLLRRSAWEVVGGFRENLRSAEDHLFISELEKHNVKISYAPQALVRWTMQPTIGLTFARFVTYSRNNLAAGLWREWQAAILLRYLILLVISFVIASFTGGWLLVVALLVISLLMGRAVVALWRNRNRYPANPGRNLRRLFVLLPIFLVLDAATFLGAMNWLVRDKLRLMR